MKINYKFTLLMLPFLMSFVTGCDDPCYEGQQGLMAIRVSILLFEGERGRFPTRDEGIQILVDEKILLPDNIKDPWGREYSYSLNEDKKGNEKFEISSNGQDGKKGGGDDITLEGCQASYLPIFSCSGLVVGL